MKNKVLGILIGLVLVGLLVPSAFGQAAISTITQKSLTTYTRGLINANFASLLANAPNGKAALTTAGRIVYVSAAGTLAEATGLLRTGVGSFLIQDPTATTGVTSLIVKGGAGQASTSIIDVKSSAEAILVSIGADGGITSAAQLTGTLLKLTTTAEPTCNAAARGTVNYVAGGAGVADTLKACVKSAADAYAWTSIIYNP